MAHASPGFTALSTIRFSSPHAVCRNRRTAHGVCLLLKSGSYFSNDPQGGVSRLTSNFRYAAATQGTIAAQPITKTSQDTEIAAIHDPPPTR